MSIDDLVVRIDSMLSSSASRTTVVTLVRPPSFFPSSFVFTFSQIASAISVATFFSTNYVLRPLGGNTFFFSESITGVSSSSVMGVSPTRRFMKPANFPRPQEFEDVVVSFMSISDSFYASGIEEGRTKFSMTSDAVDSPAALRSRELTSTSSSSTRNLLFFTFFGALFSFSFFPDFLLIYRGTPRCTSSSSWMLSVSLDTGSSLAAESVVAA